MGCMLDEALRRCPDPDVIDTQAVRLPPNAPTDPRGWVRQIFSPDSLPRWTLPLFAARQLAAPLVGARRESSMDAAFGVQQADDVSALVVNRDRHLDFWCVVAVDAERDLLSLTTVVKLHGWRGRLYWAPVGMLHASVTRGMLHRAVRQTR